MNAMARVCACLPALSRRLLQMQFTARKARDTCCPIIHLSKHSAVPRDFWLTEVERPMFPHVVLTCTAGRSPSAPCSEIAHIARVFATQQKMRCITMQVSQPMEGYRLNHITRLRQLIRQWESCSVGQSHDGADGFAGIWQCPAVQLRP